MSKRGPKKQPWQVHFWKRVKVQGEHWIWTGRFEGSAPRFNMANGASRSVNMLARELLFGVSQPSNERRYVTCGEPRCIFPKHMSDASPVPATRANELVEKYRGYIAYHRYNMAELAREYGITRERVRQILKENGVHCPSGQGKRTDLKAGT